MGKKFNHLNVPSHWEHYWTKYPEGYTILEALLNWVAQVDNLVDNVNDWNEYLDDFVTTFDKNLQGKVVSTLSEWQDSGFLDVVIDEALQTQMDVLEQETHEKLNQFSADLTQITHLTPINTFENIAEGINAFYQSLPEGATISFPRGDIEIDKPIVFDRKIHIDATGVNFIYSGTDEKPAITIGSETQDIRDITIDELRVVKRPDLPRRINSNEIGIRILNIRYSKIGFSSVGFYNNVVIDSMNSKGNVYNHYFIGFVYDGYNNLVIRTSDPTGWSNENNFYGGSLAFSSSASAEDLANVVVEHNGYRNNNNRFYGVSFEDAGHQAYAIKLDGGSHYFYGCRYEGSRKVHLGENAIDNVIMHGFGVPSSSDVTGRERGLTIVGNRGHNLKISSGNSFTLDEYSSADNKTFSINYLGEENFSVTGSGNIEGRSLKINSVLTYSGGRVIRSGRGEPEGVVTANIGSIYIEDSGAGVYYKVSGIDTNTGWRKVLLE